MTVSATTVPSRSGLATASLIFGLLAVITGIFAPGIAFLLGPGAVILGAISLGQIKTKGLQGRGLAIAGIVLGVLGALFGFFALFVLGPIIANTFSTINASLNSVGP